MRKKIFSILLSLAMVITMMPAMTMTAWAGEPTPINEIDLSGLTLGEGWAGHTVGEVIAAVKNYPVENCSWRCVAIQDIGESILLEDTDTLVDNENCIATLVISKNEGFYFPVTEETIEEVRMWPYSGNLITDPNWELIYSSAGTFDIANFVQINSQDGSDLCMVVSLTVTRAESNWSKLAKAMSGDVQAAVPDVFNVSDDASTGVRTITLLSDITATSADSALVVKSSADGGKKIVLDLNGHVLNRGLVSADGTATSNDHGSVIEVASGGELTIEDSDPDNSHEGYVDADGLWHLSANGHPANGETAKTIKGGIITGGTGKYYDEEYSGGGIFLLGKLILNNGNVAGNKIKNTGGGVYSEGTFEMNDGEILYNNAGTEIGGYGGGVYNFNGQFSIKNGVIRNNTAYTSGGGIFNFGLNAKTDIKAGMIINNEVLKNYPDAGGTGIYNNRGTLSLESTDMKEIVVTGNISKQGCITGAIAVFSGTINISGKVIIKDNYNSGKYNSNGLFYSRSQNLNVTDKINITGPLTGSDIYVTHTDNGSEDYKNNKGVLTNGYSTHNQGAKVDDFFHYDGSDPSLYMDLNKDGDNAGELEVKEVPEDYYAIQIPSIPNGKVTSDKQIATAGSTVTLTVTPDNGYELSANSLKVASADGTEIPVSGAGNTYTFTMPNSAVIVTADFVEKSEPIVKNVPLSLLRAYTGGKVGKKAVKLCWNKVSGATKYVVYGAKCGNKYKKLKTVKGTKYTVKKIKGKKLKAHKTYKFYVVAYNGNKKLIQSKSIHFITARTSGKYANIKSIKAKKSKLTLNVDAKTTVKATVKRYKGKKHLSKGHGNALKYISNCPYVATVDSKGVVRAKHPGTATIYIQDIGGRYCKTVVTVK